MGLPVPMNKAHNRLLAQFEREDLLAIQALSQSIELQAGQLLSSPGQPRPWVYFPSGATVVELLQGPGCESLAVGLHGSEGVVGLSYALGMGPGPHRLVVLTGGAALRVPAHALAVLMDQRPGLVLGLMRELWRMHSETAGLLGQLASLEIPARLALWLGLMAERAGTPTLTLTQAQLASLLGVRRVSITLAIQNLRAAGLIACQRGQITVLDAQALARMAHPAGRLAYP